MAISVTLDDEFVTKAKIHSQATGRSVPQQIEWWCRIGKMLEANPDLPFDFVKDALLAKSEIKYGKATKYVRRT